MAQLTNKEIDEILGRKPESRYKYFIRTVVAEEEIWGLADDEGWLMLEDDADNSDVIAVFPNPEFAEIFQEKAGFGEFHVEALDLYEFFEWMDDFEQENIKVGVFPTPDFHCAVMPAERLREDFQAEFDKEKD